jgi:hypothetical protein
MYLKPAIMKRKEDPKNEGHTREWQDRARVVLNAKRDAGTEASPNQSPVAGADKKEDVEEKSENVNDDSLRGPDAVY